MSDNPDFCITLDGVEWWQVVRVLEGLRPPDGYSSTLAMSIYHQLREAVG